ncbi:hypothetical protein PBOI14_18930 [Pseudomonas sp. Boi14]|nr:hypothetical protein PBOI14_18930 [Pseudomonas sp. Boi14]
MSEPTLLNNEIRDWLMDCGLFDQLLPADFNAAAGYFSISSIAEAKRSFMRAMPAASCASSTAAR